MTNAEYKTRLDALIFTCGMNKRYHQHLKRSFARWDRFIRIVVGVLAIIGLLVAFPDVVRPAIGVGVAVVSLAAAVVLNIIPVSDWSRDHAELFRLWSDLRKEAAPLRFRRLCELTGKSEALDSTEPAPNRKLLDRCYGDEMESIWGRGIRTRAQAEAQRLVNHSGPSVSTAVSEVKREKAPAAGVGG